MAFTIIYGEHIMHLELKASYQVWFRNLTMPASVPPHYLTSCPIVKLKTIHWSYSSEWKHIIRICWLTSLSCALTATDSSSFDEWIKHQQLDHKMFMNRSLSLGQCYVGCKGKLNQRIEQRPPTSPYLEERGA